MSAHVRALRMEDQAEWRKLWLGYQSFYRISIPDEATLSTWRRILDPAEPVLGLGAFDDTALRGIAHCILHRSTWMTADTCYLQDLFVAPTARRQGLARRLIEAVYAEADSRSAGQVYWLTHSTNTSARALYDRLAKNGGFVLYERHADAEESTT